MTTTVSNNICVEKLRGRDNYGSWKFAMQAWLQLDDLWNTVLGDDKDVTKDRKALSKIILSLEVINYCHVKNAKTAKEAWKALGDAFEDTGLTRRVGLLRKLITTRLENCKNVEEYVESIINTAHKLNEINFHIADDWTGTLLLAGLPDVYRPMIMGLENSGTKITGDSIKVKLLQEVKADDRTAAKSNDNETAMTASKFKNRKTKLRCYSCSKLGHVASQCRRNKYNNTQNGNQNTSTNNSNQSKRAFMASSSSTNCSDWFLDSGASAHIVKDDSLLKDCVHKNDVTITAANNTHFMSKAIGTAQIQVTDGCQSTSIDVKETLYVPEATANLLSVSKIVKKGHRVTFEQSGGSIFSTEGELIATASEINGIYKLDQPKTLAYAAADTTSGILWHRRLGHLNRKSLSLLKKMSVGMDNNMMNNDPCEACVIGKHSREPFNVSKRRSTEPLQLIHSDLCGKMEQDSIGGGKYFLTFIDDYSRYLFVYILHSKDQVYDTFKDFKNLVEKQTGKKILKFQSDNGTEYASEKMKTLFKTNGIVYQFTVRYTPSQNGVAERMNRSIVEKARTMLADAGLSKEYWAEAVTTAAYLLNRSPTRRLWNKTPYEAYTGCSGKERKKTSYKIPAYLLIGEERKYRRTTDRK